MNVWLPGRTRGPGGTSQAPTRFARRSRDAESPSRTGPGERAGRSRADPGVLRLHQRRNPLIVDHMRRDILLLLGAVIFASGAGYTYLHNDNLQVSAGVIFIGTFLLSWANPKRFLVYAFMTGSSIFIAS